MTGDDAAAAAERVRREWGLELPDALFRFWEFRRALGPAERRALAGLELSPCGLLDLFADPGARPRAGVDVRVHGRYYRDPPEFLTFMHGGSDGLHFGLWTDDGRTCSGIASYYTNDGGEIDRTAATPLEAVRAVLERVWRDLDDYGEDADEELRTGLELLRTAVMAVETGDRPAVGLAYSRAHDFRVPPPDPARLTTLDGAGALVEGRPVVDRPPQHRADPSRFAKAVYELLEDPQALEDCAREARRRCAAGDPAEALALGRDLHWASGGDPAREELADELLVSAYRALDRPALAEIAEAHHRHRSLRSVDVLERPA